MKNSGLFLNMTKRSFWDLFFEVLVLLWFVFGVSGIVPKVLKMLVFFPVFGLCGVVYSCLFGFGRFRCFCVFCVCFPFCVVFVLFVLFFVLLLDRFWCWFFFCFCVCFLFFVCFLFVFVFCFFGGFKGQARWPKGPPHLALNPPYFCFCYFLFFLFFGCFLFVFLEGLKLTVR